MMQKQRRGVYARALMGALLIMFVLSSALVPAVPAAEPIRIGFGMALTGGLAANGKAAVLSMQIWAEDVNKQGGLLGRKVELVYYDDQTKPATVPAIYSKLIDIDKVDFVVSGWWRAPRTPRRPGAGSRCSWRTPRPTASSAPVCRRWLATITTRLRFATFAFPGRACWAVLAVPGPSWSPCFTRPRSHFC